MICCPSKYHQGVNSGGGSGAGDEPSAEGQALLQSCRDTFQIANTDSDDWLTQDEFQRHIDEYTDQVCPEEALQETYYDDASLAGSYQLFGFLLCTGVLDPFNANAAEGNSESCGCMTTPPPPINIPAFTVTESDVYCALILEYVLVQCYQPERECFDACVVKSDADFQTGPLCQFGTNSSPGAYLQCMSAIQPRFLSCIQACDSYNPNISAGGTDSNPQIEMSNNAPAHIDIKSSEPNLGSSGSSQGVHTKNFHSFFIGVIACIILLF